MSGRTRRWQDERIGRWTVPIPLASDCSVLKLCPDCRVPVNGVSRYKRIINKAKVRIHSPECVRIDWCLQYLLLVCSLVDDFLVVRLRCMALYTHTIIVVVRDAFIDVEGHGSLDRRA